MANLSHVFFFFFFSEAVDFDPAKDLGHPTSEDGGRGDVEDDTLPAADPVRDLHNSETAISMSLGVMRSWCQVG